MSMISAAASDRDQPELFIEPRKVRRIILDQSFRAGVGHIGSALSVVEMLCGLYSGILRSARPDDPERDRFILSKGHAALALYAVLHLRGNLGREELDSYCGDASRLGVHPERILPCVDFSTGSLGYGLAFAAGAALAARLQNSPRRVFVLMSDAECNEGALWESIAFAAHHRLGNILALVDVNGQQALGYTREVLNFEPLAERWRAMGWQASEVDGHDLPGLQREMRAFAADGPPRVILARTVFGRGVSFMQRQIHWHYWPMNESQYRQALSEIEAEP